MSLSRTTTVVAILVLSLVAPAQLAGASGTMTTLDNNHPLASDDAITSYQENGVASGNLSSVQASIAYADDADDINCDVAVRDDLGNHWFKFEYDGEIDRTIRIHLPAEYGHPFTNTVESPTADTTADIKPINDNQYTSVEFDVNEETDTVCIPMSQGKSGWASTASGMTDRWESVTDIEVPSISGDTEWQYIGSSDWGDQTSLKIDAPRDSVKVQYAVEEDGEQIWLPAPEEQKDTTPVYVMKKSGSEDAVWVVNNVDDPPEVRFKSQGGLVDDVSSAIEDAKKIKDRLFADLPFVGE